MNLFELSLKLNGFPISEAKKKLAQIQSISESNYQEYVESKRQCIFDFHVANNPFYRNFLNGRTVNTWNGVPVMQKSDLQIPLSNRFTSGFSKKNVYINKTSGSSGHPFIFAKDKMCHALTWACIIDRYSWYNIDFNNSRQARFYGIPLDFVGYNKERFKDWLSGRYRFPIFDLSEKKLEQFLAAFKNKKIDHINGYTSSIVLFAKFIKDKGLVLKNICPSLNYCIVTSEMLYDSDKQLMENAFGIPVINEYGASELDLIGFTNSNDDFILNSETLFVEVLDEEDNPIAHGTEGRIVITSLYNKAHPMIRYDIGDIGSLSNHSTYKTPILQKLIGRTNDIARLPDGKTVPGLTFYYVTKSVIEDDGNVKEFVIEQLALNEFKIIYISSRPLNEKEIEIIENALFKYVGKEISLSFDRQEVLNRSKSGKLKQFSSRLT